jgi:hypothetical protein
MSLPQTTASQQLFPPHSRNLLGAIANQCARHIVTPELVRGSLGILNSAVQSQQSTPPLDIPINYYGRGLKLIQG